MNRLAGTGNESPSALRPTPAGAFVMSGNEEFRALMDRVLAGSEASRRKLIDIYGPQLRRAVRQRLSRQLRPKFDSCDFVQDVWASFFAELPPERTFDGPDNLAAYLARVARNKVIEAVRQRLTGQKYNVANEKSLLDSTAPTPLPPARQATPSTLAISREEWDLLLARLPPVYRRIVLLAREGRTAAEIGRDMNIPARTVRNVIHRYLPGLQL
jgi:RNA polymerase sigma factor (sigma-70 family)